MAHNTVRHGPCALPDGHKNRHRTVQNYASYLASKKRYEAIAGADNVARWRARHPVEAALSAMRTDALRRAERHRGQR
jgi:hypothetical protein